MSELTQKGQDAGEALREWKRLRTFFRRCAQVQLLLAAASFVAAPFTRNGVPLIAIGAAFIVGAFWSICRAAQTTQQIDGRLAVTIGGEAGQGG